MVPHACPVIRRSFEPWPREGCPHIQEIIIAFEGNHNHPAFSEHKLTKKALDDVRKLIKAGGDGGTTAKGVLKRM